MVTMKTVEGESHMADRAADKPGGLKRVMPILIWLPQYQKSWPKGDVIAGLVQAAR